MDANQSDYGDPDSRRTPVLELRGITKSYPGQLAVDDVSTKFFEGEVHGLVGENGAGKSTLVKMLTGAESPDSGQLFWRGQEIHIYDPADAARMGISSIHQEPAMIESLSIAENLVLGLGFETKGRLAIDWKEQFAVADGLLRQVGLRVDPRLPLASLGVHQRQLVALGRVLHQKARVVILDEVTAPLTQTEADVLFGVVNELRADGVSIIYITHRLEEIFQLTDQVTVLRNGRRVATQATPSLNTQSLTSLIIGTSERKRYQDSASALSIAGDPLLSVEGLSDEAVTDIDFCLYPGEVLGIAGLAGAGRSNILEMIFGARRRESGTMTLGKRAYSPKHPADAIKEGVVLVTEDRKKDGYVPGFTVSQSLSLPWLKRYRTGPILALKKERKHAQDSIKRWDIRTRSAEALMSQLSGGNQQKTILARWLQGENVKIVLLDEPTHGVDIGAKSEIYNIVRDLRVRGMAVLIVSSDFEELEQVCTRVLLLSEGVLVGELAGEEIKRNSILKKLYSRERADVG